MIKIDNDVIYGVEEGCEPIRIGQIEFDEQLKAWTLEPFDNWIWELSELQEVCKALEEK